MNGNLLSRPSLYPAILLAAVALITSALLALANRYTASQIAAAEARDLQRLLTQVLPPASFDNDLLADTLTLPDGPQGQPVTVHRARRLGRIEAVIFRVVGRGYGGPILCLMGVDRDGTILGVRVISHKETPGLGDKIEAARSDWIHSFTGRSLANPPPARWRVKKEGGEFDQFTGATITPRAVVHAVREGLEFFARYRSLLLQEE
ncbi:MAG: electron transport complex subunit RsxG [Hydrogenophilus sp.]|nr:electron transport complex subunit RsxG [Hydrogenophilus sp.]